MLKNQLIKNLYSFWNGNNYNGNGQIKFPKTESETKRELAFYNESRFLLYVKKSQRACAELND